MSNGNAADIGEVLIAPLLLVFCGSGFHVGDDVGGGEVGRFHCGDN